MNLILHIDEIFLKGGNQPFFYRCLRENLSSLFSGIRTSRVEGGIWVENFKEQEMARLELIPGIANFAAAFKTECNIDALKKSIDELVKFNQSKTFRITAERSNKGFEFSSMQLEKELGDYVRKKMDWKVDLSNPKITIHISIAKDYALVFGNKIDGAGGLPTGSSGKVLCLLSGGIDSPVAAYRMMCRGAEVGLVHFQNQTRVSEEVGQKILDIAKVLSKYQSKINLLILPFADLQKEIVMKVPAKFRMIVNRRIFFKIAEGIAVKEKFLALATGDSLGQVASQTLENLNAVYRAVDMLKVSPLIGSNKKDIIALAKRIGTLEISNRPYEDCCSLFVAKHPETRANIEEVVKYENGIKIPRLDKLGLISYYISTN